MSVAAAAVTRLRGRGGDRPRTLGGAIRNSDGFARLYEETVDSVYRYAMVLVRDRDRAEDVTGEVFLKAWKNRESLRDRDSALSWLLSITHNAAISVLRASRETADVNLLLEREDLGAQAEASMFAEADTASLQAAMRLLTAEQQQVLFLRFFEELPHEAVAARLNRNPNAVRAIQFRALSRLRKLLEATVERSA